MYYTIVLILGDCSLLYHQTLDYYQLAVAPGTVLNRARQAKTCIRFTVSYKFDYLYLSVVNDAMTQ